VTPSIGTIFECTGRDEVLGLLDVFLNDFAQSWFAYQLPLELRPPTSDLSVTSKIA
jgi:hypothetical protein